MKKNLLLLFGLTLFLACYTIVQAQTFVGSSTCATCHSSKYNDWIESGHPYKFTIVENGVEPTYPLEAINFQTMWMENLGDGSHTWSDIAGVIGGYGWKARFVGTDGYVVGTAGSSFSTGLGNNQFNFRGGVDYGWVDYETSNDHKLYNYSCFKCHTTGGDTTGTWLAGVDGLGTFTEGGVGCEACHGPGSDHIAGPTTANIDRVYEFAHQDNSLGGLSVDGVVQTPDATSDDVNFLCGTCHNRSYTDPINASGGFIKHHEQWDEMSANKHGAAGLTCITCHDPHKRTIWDGDGITKTCESCHSTQEAVVNHSASATCIDCHMAFAAKSGTTRGESGYKGDVRSHLFSITVNDETMFTDDSTAVRDDDTRSASLSLHYVCLGCHNDDPTDNIPDKTLAQAVTSAANMHTGTFVSELKNISLSVYPNPVVENAKISFTLTKAENVSFAIYSSTGQVVYAEDNVYKSAGNQHFSWNCTNNSGSNVESGVYFAKISIGNASKMEKIILSR